MYKRNQRFFTIDSFEILISMCSCCDEFIWPHYLSFIVLLYLERKHHSFCLKKVLMKQIANNLM
jgi:hypothetical protein